MVGVSVALRVHEIFSKFGDHGDMSSRLCLCWQYPESFGADMDLVICKPSLGNEIRGLDNEMPDMIACSVGGRLSALLRCYAIKVQGRQNYFSRTWKFKFI